MLFTYDPSVHDYSQETPQLADIGHDHFVYGSKKEIEEYRAIREKGVPMKSITIRDPNEPEAPAQEEEAPVDASCILNTPVHDTGNIWYLVLSLLLPIIGILAAVIFRKNNYIRNYKACKKGALIGFGILGAIIALFLIFLLLAVIL